MSIKTEYKELQRYLAEQKELSYAKEKEREKKRAFEDLKKLERSKEREVLTRERVVREQALAEQKAKEQAAETEREQKLAVLRASQAKAEVQRRLASQERARASAILRHERFETVKQAVKPYFKPIELGGTALRYIAKGGVQKFYVLGKRPTTQSLSYDALNNTFGGQPFTAEQATTVIMNTRPTDYADAINRLRLMKQYGMIREG